MPRATPVPELFAPTTAQRPLAERMRPGSLGDIVGQDHLLGPAGTLTRMLERATLASLILWGPPGVGKTTVARVLAEAAGLHFAPLSAVFSGVADLRRAFEEAARRRATGQRTLLFVDEVHRFNRTQQDAFLPVVEDGTIVLVGATTENPSFALNGALLSRCQVLVLRRLDAEALAKILARAEADAGRALPVQPDARAALCAMADGDGRYLLNMAEQLLAMPDGPALDTAGLAEVIGRRAVLFDSERGQHDAAAFGGDGASQVYALLSAFHKSIRGSDVDAALYYAGRMLLYGADLAPTVFRRLACAASEDVGMADPQALVQVLTAWQAFERVGWPEGRLFVAQAVAYVATAPKSNAAYMAFNEATAAAERTKTVSPPPNALNAPTRLMTSLGHGQGYRYDHDTPEGFAANVFWPEGLDAPTFYRPTGRGFEREIGKRLAHWLGLRSGR